MAQSRSAPRAAELDLDQHLDHTKALWRVQRVGWGLMVLILAAAMAGAFGNGPLAHQRAETGGLRVEYERFARHGAPTLLRAVAAPSARRGDTLRLWIDHTFLDEVEIQQVTPEPERVETRGRQLWFTFAAAADSAPAVITLQLRPAAYWSRPGRIGLDGGSEIALHQFVYP